MIAERDLTVVILTLDEESHLPECLASLTWAPRVLVLDSGSVDRTVALAREGGAIVEHHPFVNYAQQRQHALSLCVTPWVLFVDADERTPAPLAEEIRRTVDHETIDGYWIPRKNRFWGHTMRGGGWWPDHQLRLLRVAKTSFDPRRAVHEVAHVDGATSTLTAPLVHINYESVSELRAKQAAYAPLDVQHRLSEGFVARRRHVLSAPVREFWRRFVSLSGWRDGTTGLVACTLMAHHELDVMRRLRRAGAPG